MTDKSVLNKQQSLSQEVELKLKLESSTVLNIEGAASKEIDPRKDKKNIYSKKNKKDKSKIDHNIKYPEEDQGKIVDFRG